MSDQSPLQRGAAVPRAPYASQRFMQPEWHPDELAQHWTLSPDERALLSNKTGATRLRFAVLLKVFQYGPIPTIEP